MYKEISVQVGSVVYNTPVPKDTETFQITAVTHHPVTQVYKTKTQQESFAACRDLLKTSLVSTDDVWSLSFRPTY